jgi:hypothetical protein
MGSAISSASSIGGSIGGAIGGIIGQGNASGDASQAQSQAALANQIMQQMASVPDISKPLVLDQYRQAGVLTPAMEQQINLGVSQASQVKANPALQAAQNQALQQMATRSQTGLTASDRAAFNQLQSQVGANTQGREQAIMQQQQAQTGGQGIQGASLAAKLSASQAGANTEATQADQLAAQASNNALQATTQYGQMAGQMNSQQYQQQQEAAKAADAFRQFDVQNQVAQQQRNITAQNQAQQYNLNLAQNTNNANVSQANQEANNQLQREAQQWQLQYQQAAGQSAAAAGYGNVLSGQAQQIAQAGANLGAGLGGAAGSAASYAGSSGGGGDSGGDSGGDDSSDDFYRGGRVKGYADGGSVNNQTAFSQLNPIQLTGLMQQAKGGAAQYNLPQRQEMAALQIPTVKISDKDPAKNAKAVPMGTSSDSTDPNITGSNNLLVQNGDASTGQVMAGGSNDNSGISDPAGLAGLLDQYGSAPQQQQTAYNGGQIHRQDYRNGGKVKGKAPVKGDSPKNDIVPAKLSPGEVVLPRSIASKLKNAPDSDFHEHLNKIVGPFIRKSQQEMAKGGEVDSKPEHDKRNLKELSKAFANFLKEEGNEKYADGGEVPTKKSDFEAQEEAIAQKKAILKHAGYNPDQSDFEVGEEAAEANRRANPSDDHSSNNIGYDDGGEVDDSDSDDDSDDGINASDSPLSNFSGNNQGIQAAAQADAGMNPKVMSGAPPPRGNMVAAPPKQQSSGGGGGDDSGMGDAMSAMEFMAADGGEAPDNDDDTAWGRLKKTLKDQFNPPPTPPAKDEDPEATREKNYAEIRHQNLVNMGEAEGDKTEYKGGAIKEQKFADGGESIDDSQPAEPDTSADDQDDGSDEDPIYVRAKPNSDKDIDELGKEQFEDDKDSPKVEAKADEDDDKDRSKDPADLEDVSKELADDKNPEDEDAKTKKVIADFDKAEHPEDERKVASADDAIASDADITNDDVKQVTQNPNEVDDDEQPVKAPEQKISDFQQQLRRAQAQRQAILAGAQGAKYGALIAAGLAGHGAKPAGAEYFNNDALAQTPVQNIKERADAEMNDPDSGVSKFYRQRLKESLGTTVAPDVSAAGLKALFPQVTKVVGQDYAAYQKQQDRALKERIANQNNATKRDVTNTRVGAQRDIATQRNATAKDIAGQKNSLHVSDKDKAEQDKITKELNSLQASSRSVLGSAAMTKQRVQKLKDIVNDPNATPQDMNLAASELNTAVTNTSTVAGAKGLEYHNLQTGLANLMQKYTSNPHAPNVPEIKKHIAELADRMANVSDDVISNNAGAIKAGHTDFVSKYPDRWNDMLSANTGSGMPTVPQAPGAPVPGQTPGRTVVKKGYNAKTNQTQFIYSDGTKETKSGKL